MDGFFDCFFDLENWDLEFSAELNSGYKNTGGYMLYNIYLGVGLYCFNLSKECRHITKPISGLSPCVHIEITGC